MNILILSWRGPGHTHAGGAEAVTHAHAKAWVESGHSVTLFTSIVTGDKKEEVIDGVKVIRRGNQFPGVQFNAFLWYIFGRHEKYDLIIDQFHGLPFFAPLYTRKPVVGFIHEVAKEVWGLNPWPKPFNLIPAFIGETIEPFVFKYIYRNIPFMTVSESTRQDLISWQIPVENIKVILNGVNLTLPKVLPAKEKLKTVIFLGALAKDKGIEDAIEVFSKLKSLGGDWQFWVVGKGDKEYLSKLREQAAQSKIVVKFWGFVNEKTKFELLARSHLLLNPSVREGWGLVNIEANAVGTPVIGYKAPGVVDSVKHLQTGILVEIGDKDALVKAVAEVLQDRKLYQQLSRNALSWSKKFVWEEKTTESLKLIDKYVSN